MNNDQRATMNMTAATIGRDLLQALVTECRLLPDVWPKISKAKQDDVIERLRKRVDDSVRMAVHLIASEGRATADATIESVTFKNGIKAVLNLSKNSPQRHAIADSEGKLVLIVVADAGEHTGGMDDITGEADQREMDLGHEYQDNDGGGMDEAKTAAGDVEDLEPKALPDSPLQSQLDAAYQAGRTAAANGDPKDAAPVARYELVERWTQGWVDWHDEQSADADAPADAAA